MKIYLDESGNLGCMGKNALEDDQHFVIAALIVQEELPIVRCMKKIRQRKIKKKYRKISELKFRNSDEAIRRRVLECIAQTNNYAAYALLRKGQVYEDLQDKPQVVYNYLCKQLMMRIAGKLALSGRMQVIVDKSLYGVQRENFDNYIEWIIGRSSPVEVDVTHVDSRQCPCVQAADFLAGAIIRRYKNNDDRYYLKIKPRIIAELDFFQPKL